MENIVPLEKAQGARALQSLPYPRSSVPPDARAKNQVKYLLINPPLTDPTGPYHSISYLVGAASAAGYKDFYCLDANVEAINYLTQPEQVVGLLEECANVRATLEGKRDLTRGEQLLYRCAVKAVGMEPDAVVRAINVFKDPIQFYRYGAYRQAVMVVNRWFDTLSVYGFPGQFSGLTLNLEGVGNLSSIRDLGDTKYIDRLTRPFAPYFQGPFTRLLQEQRWNVAGLSVNYIAQLPFAIFATRMIRALCPECVLCLGGTEITDVVKYLKDYQLAWTLFPGADALVVGEGETAFTEILRSVSSGDKLPKGSPGILLPDDVPTRGIPSFRYEDMATLPPPRYDIWDLTQYWAPEPVVMYSPTRGCYWNRCTFCDYGLNMDLPTSPSRERPAELVLKDIHHVIKSAQSVYLAVDAMSPRFLRRWANIIAESDIKIRWSAELRLERTFVRGLADELSRSGCVALSFGYESGSQRVLDLINKGVKLENLPGILAELSRVGIGVQMMGFIGFPTETAAEAYETFAFLRRYSDYWTLAGIGDFVLTQGAIVAKRPKDFGITEIHPLAGDDIWRSLYWVDGEGQRHGLEQERSPELNRIARSIARFVDDRPFVGGIDSAHSILYFAKNGRSLVPNDVMHERSEQWILSTVEYYTPLEGVAGFVDQEDLEEYRQQERSCGRELTSAGILRWLSQYPSLGNAPETIHGQTLEIYPSGRFTATAGREIFKGSEAYRSLKKILLEAQGVV
jgi:hypothetical protein